MRKSDASSSFPGWFRFILALIFFGSGLIQAQSTTGSIAGTIRDTTGGVVPGVEVVAIHPHTRVSYTAVSGESGFYEVLRLPPGLYEIRAQFPGFQTFVARNITVQVRETPHVDITLEVGDISQSITVEGATGRAESRKAEMGKVVTRSQVVDLPLERRDSALGLARLQPGVVLNYPGTVSEANFSVNGQRGQNNNFLLEGGNNNDLAANFITSNPNVEALQEFKVQASTYDAEFGRNSGAQINAVIRSGSNEVHGNVYAFHRNDALGARSFFAPEPEKLIRNQFGFTLGGPVIKNKFFLFGSYEGFRERSDEALTDALVPSQAVRDGNVGDLLSPDGRDLLDPDGDGRIEVSPLSKTLLDRFVPLPTGPVDPATGLGQLSQLVRKFENRDQFIIKGDIQIRDNNHLSITYLFDDFERFHPIAFLNPPYSVPGFGDFGTERTQNAILQNTHTFSPTAINHLRFAYNRDKNLSVIPENTDDPASLGFTGIVPKNGATASVPNIDISGEFFMGSSFAGPQSRGDDTFDLSDTASWIRGDHSLQSGFGWSHFNQDAFFDFANNGLFVFAGIFGTPTVDFLAGTPLLYLQGGLPDLRFRQNSFARFVNDNWRVSDRLTVNLGLRYELFLPAYETQDQIGTVDFIGNKEVGDAQSQRFPDAPPGLLFPGDPGIPRSTTETDYSNFAPRIGLAYDLTGDSRMTLRAGYGIYYNLLNLEPHLNFLFGQPFGLQTTLGPAVGGGGFVGGPFGGFVGGPQHFAAPFSGQTNPFPPSGEFLPPAELSVLGPRVQTPYSHQFSLSYQWEVAQQYLLEIAYVGSTGIHLLLADRYNLIPYSRNSDNTIDILDSAPGNPNILQNQFLQDTAANSSYHSLQMSLNRRFSNGLGLLGS